MSSTTLTITQSEMDLQDWFEFHKASKDAFYEVFFRHQSPLPLLDLFISLWASLGRLVALREGPTPCGVLHISPYPKPRFVELGLLLYKPWQGKGIASFVMTSTIAQIFENDYDRVVVQVPSDHPSLNSMLRSNGFRIEATIPNLSFYNNKLHDENRYCLTKEDLWLSLPQPLAS